MRIAYFTDTFTPEVNGVTNTLTRLSAYLEKKSVQHVFFAPDYHDTQPDCPAPLAEIKKVYRFSGLRVSISPGSCLAFPKARDIYNLCAGFAPDLIHVVTEFGIGFRGMKYALSRELPLIMSYHTDYCKYLEFFDLNPLEAAADLYLRWFHSFAHKTLVPSKHTLARLAEKEFKNLGLWTRGVDTDKFSPESRCAEVRDRLGIGERFAFLYVGRLSPEKGLHLLLRAIEEMNRTLPGQAVFVITGDGPYAENIRQAGFDNVILTGFKHGRELSEIYASCDCFAFPSGTETFGNTPLEALASGLPVAGVSAGGVTDFLLHKHNALLAPDGDGEAFVENLISVMTNGELRQSLSKNARKTAVSRNWNEVFDGLLNDYQSVIEHNTAAAWKRAS